MEELLIEKKAKRYDKAIERAKNYYSTTDSASDIKLIGLIFPELKESEDERIKKSIIEHLKCDIDDMAKSDNAFEYEAEIEELSKYIAWLEKQGEQKPIDPDTLIQQRVDALADIVADQKPTDKIEPKFKAGNWYQCTKDFFGKGVTFDKNTAYYCAKEGCLQDEYGCHIAIVKDLYDNFKLWTIEDAKDGDVLATDDWVFIFKELNAYGKPVCYCHYDDELGFKVDVNSYLSTGSEIYPATKEQRDLLFQKIHEAEYEWVAEKKELKKIEHNNSAWSEEDERILVEMIKIFNIENFEGYNIGENNEDALKFLNSIKYRVVSQEWSEEDEQLYNDLSDTYFYNDEDYPEETYKRMIKKVLDWMNKRAKSLRTKTTWKPSDVQLRALKEACDEHWEPDGSDPLYVLYQNLKKLRDE